MSSADAPSPPLIVKTPVIILRNDEGGNVSTRTVPSVAATNAIAAILRSYCAEVIEEHVRLREPKFQTALSKPLIFTIVSIVWLTHLEKIRVTSVHVTVD